MLEILLVFIPLLVQSVISFIVSVICYGNVDITETVFIKGMLCVPIFAVWYLWDRSGRRYPDFQMMLRRMFRRKEKLPEWSVIFRFAVYPFLLGVVINVLISSLMVIIGIYNMFSNDTQNQLLRGAMVFQILGPGIVNPIAEELVFRGLTYSRMKQLMPRMSAVFLNGFLFAAYHGNPIQMIYALPMGLILIWLYEKENSIILPIMFHIGANMTTILLSAVLR